jgi:hypothetical protein
VCHTSIWRPTPTAKYRPEGEKERAEIAPLKEKLCRTILRGTFVKIVRPSSSTERRRLPRGVRASLVIFFRCANGNVCDVLLTSFSATSQMNGRIPYFTRSKTVTRLPTGDRRQVPSGLKSRFPWLYTVPRRFENWIDISNYKLWIRIKSNLKLRLHCHCCMIIVYGSSAPKFPVLFGRGR